MADFVDFNGDGQIDIAFAERNGGQLVFFLNSGDCDEGGQPIFVKDAVLDLPFEEISTLQAVDLDGDGRLDLVVNGYYIHNRNPAGWPFNPAAPVDLGAGPNVTFLDLDGDGVLELLALGETGQVHNTGQRQPKLVPAASGTAPFLWCPDPP